MDFGGESTVIEGGDWVCAVSEFEALTKNEEGREDSDF